MQSQGWGAHCTMRKHHLLGLMRGPLHTRQTSSLRREEGPTAHWVNLIIGRDEGLVAHWVSLIFQAKLGMRGSLHTGLVGKPHL